MLAGVLSFILMIDITFLGHSSFKIKGRQGQIVTDPPTLDVAPTKLTEADIIILTDRDNTFHSNTKIVKESGSTNPFVIEGPGEYEIRGINIVGILGKVGKKENGGREIITLYQFYLDNLSFAHLGNIGEKLTQKQVEFLGDIDVLMLPVGGTYTVDPKGAVEIVAQLEPKIVLPMHFGENQKEGELLGLEKFLAQIGEKIQPEEKLVIARDKLPSETQVKVLEKQG